jgi:TPR repeat protein
MNEKMNLSEMILKISVFIAALGLADTAFAGLAEGEAALQAGDHAKALKEFEPLAKQGDAYAQYSLGHMFDKAWGVPEDFTKAADWYRKAAGQGNAAAQWSLGGMYYNGRGLPQSDEEAVRWYRMAAAQGYPQAENNLGFMYGNGFGVPRDDVLSAEWYRKAAEHGYAFAQNALGYRYEMGQGVSRDIVVAHVLYSVAASNGNDVGTRNLARITPAMTSEQLKEAREMAAHWQAGMALPGKSNTGAVVGAIPFPHPVELKQ